VGVGGDRDRSLQLLHRSEISLKMCEVVLPTKRRVMPKGGEDDWALSQAERLVRKPGAYLAADTSLRLTALLHRPFRPLVAPLASGSDSNAAIFSPRPFARAVFVFEYKDVPMLHAVTRAIDDVNTRALGDDIQGSLRSHQLSAEQTSRAENGALDLMCGFQLIDVHCRMVVVEGLAASVAAQPCGAVPPAPLHCLQR
jgi:hypothetical protein